MWVAIGETLGRPSRYCEARWTLTLSTRESRFTIRGNRHAISGSAVGGTSGGASGGAVSSTSGTNEDAVSGTSGASGGAVRGGTFRDAAVSNTENLAPMDFRWNAAKVNRSVDAKNTVDILCVSCSLAQDKLLLEGVEHHASEDCPNWMQVAGYVNANLRSNESVTNEQCRQRWKNHVNPHLRSLKSKDDPWTEEEVS